MANYAGYKSAVIQAGGKSGRIQGVSSIATVGPTAPFLVNEDFATDPSWTATGTVTQNTGEVVAVTSSGTEDYLREIVGNQAEMWVGCDFSLDAGFVIVSPTQSTTVCSIMDGGTFVLYFTIINDGGTLKFSTIYRGDSGTTTVTVDAPTFTLGQTYSIVLRTVDSSGSDATDGIAQAWVDNTNILDVSDIDNDNTIVDSIRVGATNTGATVSGTTRVDNVKVSTTGVS